MNCPDCGTALSQHISKRKTPFERELDNNSGYVLHTEKRCIETLKVKLAVLKRLGEPLIEYMEILGKSPRGAVLLWHVDSKNGDTVVTAQELKALADALKETSR